VFHPKLAVHIPARLFRLLALHPGPDFAAPSVAALAEADALTHLGDTRQAAGDTGSARAAWQQALAILDDIGHPEAQAVRDRLQTAAVPEVTG
jgi:hypothetical protein